jgi:hypothetical protein
MVFDDSGSIAVYNPDKQISEQITLKNLIILDKAMRLSRFGVPDEPTEKPLSKNERISLRFKGLNEIIYAQQSIITSVTSAIVKSNSLNDWNKKYKELEEKEKYPFEEDDNDYNELRAILAFLKDSEQKIISARLTERYNDDFVWKKKDNQSNEVLELSPHFFTMMSLLEESYEVIYGIMLKNKIVSSGISINEELEDKEKEEECMRRIVDS